MFRFIKALQEVIYSAIDGPSSAFKERIRSLWSDFCGIMKTNSGNDTATMLSHIICIMGRVLVFKDVSRLVIANNSKMPHIDDDLQKRDITLLIFRGHVGGIWKQEFDQDDIQRSDWVVFPRVLRLSIKSENSKGMGRPREVNVANMRYIPVAGIDETGTCRDVDDHVEGWREIVFCLVRDNPFDM
jgi:hypothetical protein